MDERPCCTVVCPWCAVCLCRWARGNSSRSGTGSDTGYTCLQYGRALGRSADRTLHAFPGPDASTEAERPTEPAGSPPCASDKTVRDRSDRLSDNHRRELRTQPLFRMSAIRVPAASTRTATHLHGHVHLLNEARVEAAGPALGDHPVEVRDERDKPRAARRPLGDSSVPGDHQRTGAVAVRARGPSSRARQSRWCCARRPWTGRTHFAPGTRLRTVVKRWFSPGCRACPTPRQPTWAGRPLRRPEPIRLTPPGDRQTDDGNFRRPASDWIK